MIEEDVIYFPPDDLAHPYFARKVVQRIEGGICFAALRDGEEAVQLYDIARYLEDLQKRGNPEAVDLAQVRKALAEIRQLLGTFFGSASVEDLRLREFAISSRNGATLIECLTRFASRLLEDRTLPQRLIECGFRVRDLLANKKFVKNFDEELAFIMRADPRNAELVLDHVLLSEGSSIMQIPKQLSKNDRETLVENYVRSSGASINYLQKIADLSVSRKLEISPRTRLDAARKVKRWVETNRKEMQWVELAAEVQFDPDQEQHCNYSEASGSPVLTFSTSLLMSDTDPGSILDNFIYFFSFTNLDGTLTFPAGGEPQSVFEQIFTAGLDNFYPADTAFRITDQLSTGMVMAYGDFLSERGIYLEDIVSWFFEEYLVVEFGVSGFKFEAAGRDDSYSRKCRNLFPQLEGNIRRFALYCETDEVDPALLQLSYNKMEFGEVPSLHEQKYAKLTKEGEEAVHLLYSSSSVLRQSDSDPVVAAIVNGEFEARNLDNRQLLHLEKLIEWGLLERRGKKVVPKNKRALEILGILHRTGEIELAGLPEWFRSAAQDLLNANLLEPFSALLSIREAEYYSYCLSNKHVNGLGIRNQWGHGIESAESNEDDCRDQYFLGLKLLLGLVIKMNDEFCIREQDKLTPNISPE